MVATLVVMLIRENLKATQKVGEGYRLRANPGLAVGDEARLTKELQELVQTHQSLDEKSFWGCPRGWLWVEVGLPIRAGGHLSKMADRQLSRLVMGW